MASAPKLIMGEIRSLKLAPTDILVLHFEKNPDAETRAELHNMLTQAQWGADSIKYMIIHGKFQVGSVKPGEHS